MLQSPFLRRTPQRCLWCLSLALGLLYSKYSYVLFTVLARRHSCLFMCLVLRYTPLYAAVNRRYHLPLPKIQVAVDCGDFWYCLFSVVFFVCASHIVYTPAARSFGVRSFITILMSESSLSLIPIHSLLYTYIIFTKRTDNTFQFSH
ncbi:hypothetical protein BDW60DRAFT_36722 [Aspergillus nidulans var. acristatus]